MLRNFSKDRVVVQDELGKGGFGKVYPYKNRDGSMEDYCVKSISMKEKPPIEEILVGYQIKHPFAIPILGYYIEKPLKEGEDWQFYLKMKRMKGSLKDLIERKGDHLKLDQIVKCTYRLASTLAYLQSNDIAHRDVKPSNILLDKQGNVFISDFGLCTSMIEKEQTMIFVINGVAGTEIYLAPELKEKKQGFTPDDLYRGDAWSLGLTILDICLFDIKGNGHISSLPEKLRKISEEYDPNIQNIISKLLDREAEKRMTFSEVCESLQKTYGNILEETLEILQEEVQPSESIQKKWREKKEEEWREKNEEQWTKLVNVFMRLSSEFSREFNFNFAKGKLAIAAKDRLRLSDQDLKRLSMSLTESLEGETSKKLSAIEVDFSLCSKITNEGVGALKLLDSKEDLIQELNIKLFNCNNLSEDGIFPMLSENSQNLQSLKTLRLNMAGCERVNRDVISSLLLNLKNFEKLERLDLNFSGCHAKKITEDDGKNLIEMIKNNLKDLKELTLDLSDTESDCEETRSLIEESLASFEKRVIRVIIY